MLLDGRRVERSGKPVGNGAGAGLFEGTAVSVEVLTKFGPRPCGRPRRILTAGPRDGDVPVSLGLRLPHVVEERTPVTADVRGSGHARTPDCQR